MLIALLFAMLSVLNHAGAQNISDTLEEVRIKGKRKTRVSDDERLNIYSPGQKLKTIDSSTLVRYEFQSVAHLLAQQTSVFVKSYGINSLATLNFRGASAAQSQVYWNGVPLQNAALGIADVSLLPVSLMSKVNIVYGSSSALWGSGNVGGALLVENETAHFDSNSKFKHAVSAVAGSFSQYRLGLNSSLSTKKWFFSANLFGQTSENDFSYKGTTGNKRMDNAKMQSGVGLLQGAYKINQQNTISLYAWYQQYHREIPPALFEPYSVKNQLDESLRLLSEWKRKGDKTTLYTRVSFVSDRMQYEDPSIALLSENTSNQLYAEAGFGYILNYRHRFLLFIPVQSSWINRHARGDVHYQNKISIAGAWLMQYAGERLQISLNARAEQVDNNSYFLPGINASFKLTGWLAARANVQKSYRVPTLNELYYVPGGNDRLKPEQGWSQDAGYTIKAVTKSRFSFSHDLSLFNRLINDWIIWLGAAVWTPHNIAAVHSRGLETENNVEWKWGKTIIKANVTTAYILATTVDSYIPNDGSIDKQIPYSPRYNLSGNIGIEYNRLSFYFNHTYTGYRFITTDESQYLMPYSVSNVQLHYQNAFSFPVSFYFQVNNLFSVRYQVVNSRPMPLVNFLAALKFSF